MKGQGSHVNNVKRKLGLLKDLHGTPHDQCPFISQCKQKVYFNPYTSIYFYAKATGRKISIFLSRDQWHSLENICEVHRLHMILTFLFTQPKYQFM